MKLSLFEAGFVTIVARFGLMMGIVIFGLFAGIEWFMLLALPVFLSALLGIKITFVRPATAAKPHFTEPKGQPSSSPLAG